MTAMTPSHAASLLRSIGHPRVTKAPHQDSIVSPPVATYRIVPSPTVRVN
jgi:hypothetical protein